MESLIAFSTFPYIHKDQFGGDILDILDARTSLQSLKRFFSKFPRIL